MAACPGCGAVYASAEESCAGRFEALLALDHSRAEPWGSRHALAFSAFAFQHPDRFARDVLERAWLILFSVYVMGRSADRVVKALRRAGKRLPDWGLPSLPPGDPAPHFAVTIADLGSFPAETYPAQLDNWCRAALAGWRAFGAVQLGLTKYRSRMKASVRGPSEAYSLAPVPSIPRACRICKSCPTPPIGR